MPKMFADHSEVKTKGQNFVEYGENLNQLLNKINGEIDDIAVNVEGSAVQALLSTYEDIRDGILYYSKKIIALGNALEASAEAKANVNEAAAKAAGGATTV